MFQYPLQDAVCPALPGSRRKNDFDELLLRIIHLNAVECKKNQHGVGAGTLVAVHKGVVTHKPEAKLCGFRLYGGVQIFPGKGGKRRVQGGF